MRKFGKLNICRYQLREMQCNIDIECEDCVLPEADKVVVIELSECPDDDINVEGDCPSTPVKIEILSNASLV